MIKSENNKCDQLICMNAFKCMISQILPYYNKNYWRIKSEHINTNSFYLNTHEFVCACTHVRVPAITKSTFDFMTACDVIVYTRAGSSTFCLKNESTGACRARARTSSFTPSWLLFENISRTYHKLMNLS